MIKLVNRTATEMRDAGDKHRVSVSGKRSPDDLSSSPHTTSKRVQTGESNSTAGSLPGPIHDADLGDSEAVAALSPPDLLV